MEARGVITVTAEDGRSLEGTAFDFAVYHGDMHLFQTTGSMYNNVGLLLDNENKTMFDVVTSVFGSTFELEGFWRTWFSVDNVPVRNEQGQWVPQPWDIRIVLRRKINPRPLFSKAERDLLLPELDVKYGYDLEVGDLVRPHGRGRRADMILEMTGEVDLETQEYDVTLTLSFPNPNDGFLPVANVLQSYQKSILLLGHTAPAHGYQRTLSQRVFRQQVDGRFRRGSEPPDWELGALEGAWFRVHTEEADSPDGEVRGRHGKMFHRHVGGPFGFVFRLPMRDEPAAGYVSFAYFYAPDFSRSLEFNGTNLTPEPPGRIGNYYPLDKH